MKAELARFRPLFIIVTFILLVLALLTADRFCYELALPVEIDIQQGRGILHVDSQTIPLGSMSIPTTLSFAPHDPVIHEYQLDGTDSTNNRALDPEYLHQIAPSPYYRFQAWMRDLDGTSRWRDLQIKANGQLREIGKPANGSQMALPSSSSLNISVRLQRPETPMTLSLIFKNGANISIKLNRNDRHIAIYGQVPGMSSPVLLVQKFFPLDPIPFAAMVADFLIRTVLWSIVLLIVVAVGDVAFVLIREAGQRFARPILQKWTLGQTETNATGHNTYPPQRYLFDALHPIALVALGGSLLFVSWIAYVQYHAQPHIYDANTYFLTAKMYASGQLSVPVPPTVDRFPGAFMVEFDGRWFPQYPPGTALTLVPGIWLGVPWLIEPLLGTFALLGIGLIAARLYDRRVATLAVVLGVLSPFYSYLAASYLSHTVALFYLVWGLWALLRFAQGEAGWNMLLSAVCFGMAGLTRDLVVVLLVTMLLPGIVLLTLQGQGKNWPRWIIPGIAFGATILLFVAISLLFNRALTGNPLVTPRTLFFAGDSWGFGQGVGFYGQHTLAAGFVNLDALLTILTIDLFGWPFYFTLAFIAIPFLTKRAKGSDWLMLVILCIMVGAYMGYFYHGIYLGPRYFFEELPFLLILTTRGIFTLGAWGLAIGQMTHKWISSRITIMKSSFPSGISITMGMLVTGLVLCNLLYFLPRQIELHRDYTGLGQSYRHLDVAAIYHPPVHNAIVITNNYEIYHYVLFSLNDLLFPGDVIYAHVSSPSDYEQLRTTFPGRQLYQLNIDPKGKVDYVPLTDQ